MDSSGFLPDDQVPEGVTYTEARLPELDDAGFAIWKALHNLRATLASFGQSLGGRRHQHADAPRHSSHSHGPKRSEAATSLVRELFNWDELKLPEDVAGTFHGVVFRSKRRSGSESIQLYAADRRAHEEAVASGGLLMYWFGVPDADGMNLATCVWRDVETSITASSLPRHREAVRHARSAYEGFELSTYQIEKRAGETGVHIL